MNFLLLIFNFFFMLCVNSNAYADPGSGSFIIQALIAFFGAIIIFLKNPIFFIKNFFVNLKNKFKKDQKDKKDNQHRN